jgi:enediyne biosynthesis thioesterase
MTKIQAEKWFEYQHIVTFADTNVVGNVYFAYYFDWQGKCRDTFLREIYPEFVEDMRRGFSLITEFAHVDFMQEAALFDVVIVRMRVKDLTRTRIESEFEYIRQSDGNLLAKGRQAVIWLNAQHRPSLMPDALYERTLRFFTFSNF